MLASDSERDLKVATILVLVFSGCQAVERLQEVKGTVPLSGQCPGSLRGMECCHGASGKAKHRAQGEE